MPLALPNTKLEIKLKITLKNGNDLTGGDGVGPLNEIHNALFISMEMELEGCLSPTAIQNTQFELKLKN